MNLVIIGAGPGGYVSAIRSAQLGLKVTVIEESEVGGTCLNWGCIPTKSILASTELLSDIKKADDFGIKINGEFFPDIKKILDRKDRIVKTQIKGIKNIFKYRNIELIYGSARFLSKESLSILTREGKKLTLNTNNIIIATGSRALEIPELPFDGTNIISNIEALSLPEIPNKIAIIGSGASGCEFANIFKGLGSDVYLIEILHKILPYEDKEITDILEREFRKKGIKIITSARIIKVEKNKDSINVSLSNGEILKVDKILVTTGRKFNSDRINIENAGIRLGDRGEILVNENMETNINGIYAIGDVTGGPLLAHVASYQGILAAENILGANKKMDYSKIPYAIFTSPEIASVGIKEYQAEEKGIQYVKGYFHFRGLGRSHTLGKIEGMVKIIADKKTDKLLGLQIIGPHASEIIHEGALAINNGLKAKDIIETIHVHPTLSEVIKESAEDVYKISIHKMREI